MSFRKFIRVSVIAITIAVISVSLVGFGNSPVAALTGELSMMSWNVRGYHLGNNELRSTNLDDPNTVVAKLEPWGSSTLASRKFLMPKL